MKVMLIVAALNAKPRSGAGHSFIDTEMSLISAPPVKR
jgi:hypothetical protein